MVKAFFQELVHDFIWNTEKDDDDVSEDRYEFNDQLIKSFEKLSHKIDQLNTRVESLEKVGRET